MAKRLFKQIKGTLAAGALSDELYAIAANIEDAYIQAGAKAGTDYTYKDLIKTERNNKSK